MEKVSIWTILEVTILIIRKSVILVQKYLEKVNTEVWIGKDSNWPIPPSQHAYTVIERKKTFLSSINWIPHQNIFFTGPKSMWFQKGIWYKLLIQYNRRLGSSGEQPPRSLSRGPCHAFMHAYLLGKKAVKARLPLFNLRSMKQVHPPPSYIVFNNLVVASLMMLLQGMGGAAIDPPSVLGLLCAMKYFSSASTNLDIEELQHIQSIIAN